MLSSQRVDHHPVFNLCKIGDLNSVKSLLTKGEASIEWVDFYGNSMLYYACLCGHTILTRYLLEMGARDDRFGRCYLNALSLEIRRILKVYHSYATQQKVRTQIAEEAVEESDDNLLVLMKKYAYRCIFAKPEDENKASDIELHFQFKGETNPTVYKCQRWILLSRWPQIIKFATMKGGKVFTELEPLTSDELQYSHLQSNREVEEYVQSHFNLPNAKSLNTKIRQLKQHMKKYREKLQIVETMKNYLQFANDIKTEEDATQFMNKHLTIVDFGKVPFKKETFDSCLVWIYSAQLVNPHDKKSNLYSESNLQSLLGVAVALDLQHLAWQLLHNIIPKKISGQNLNNVMIEQFKSDMSPLSYCLESIQPSNPIDIMRRLLCTMKITLATDDSDIPSPGGIQNKTSSDAILCNKYFLMDRSMFFEVIVNCQFAEGEQIRDQESKNEIPVIEFQQCSDFDVLVQTIGYIYSEQAQLTKTNVVDIIVQAQRLGFSNLVQSCETFLIKNFSAQDYFGASLKAERISKDEIFDLLTDLNCDTVEIERIINKAQRFVQYGE